MHAIYGGVGYDSSRAICSKGHSCNLATLGRPVRQFSVFCKCDVRERHANNADSGSLRQQTAQQQRQQQQLKQHQKGTKSTLHGARTQQQRAQPQQCQQPLLLFQGNSSSSSSSNGGNSNQGAATDAQGMLGLLINRISTSQDLHQMRDILQIHRNAVNPVVTSAVISRLAKLYPGKLSKQQQQRALSKQQLQAPDRAQQQQLHQQLQQLIEPLLQQFVVEADEASMLEISCVIGGLARLGCNNCHDVITACVDVSRDMLHDTLVDNKLLMQLAWGLARLSHRPDDDWLQTFEAETCHRLPTMNNIESANVFWVFAKWGVKPSPTWLSTFLNHLPSQLLNLQPPEICSILWAAAMLQIQLPPSILDSLLLEAQVKFASFTGQGFGTLVWSLARMDVKPKRMWIQDFVRHSGAALPLLSRHGKDQGFTNILWALGCWEHVPPQQWLQDFCRCIVPQLQYIPPEGLTITAVGLAEMHHKPPSAFTCYLLELFHQSLPTAAAKESASFMWALPRLLLPETLSAAVAAAGSRQQQEPGIATAGWLRQYCWLLQDIADHILSGLDKLSHTDLIDAVSGFADLGFFPGVPWMDAHETNLNRQLDQLTAVQINLVKKAYMRLEQVQQQQQQLLHQEQLQLLQQQQRLAGAAVAAGGGGGVRVGEKWRSGRLAASAAAAAAATAADSVGVDASSLGDDAASLAAAAAAQSSSYYKQQQQQQQQQINARQERRLQPPAWASSNAPDSSSNNLNSNKKRRSRRNRWKRDNDIQQMQPHEGLSVGFGPQKPLVIPQRPRAARIRLQRLRESERQQREEEAEEWQRRLAQKPKRERWRVAKPGEFEDDE